MTWNEFVEKINKEDIIYEILCGVYGNEEGRDENETITK